MTWQSYKDDDNAMRCIMAVPGWKPNNPMIKPEPSVPMHTVQFEITLKYEQQKGTVSEQHNQDRKQHT